MLHLIHSEPDSMPPKALAQAASKTGTASMISITNPSMIASTSSGTSAEVMTPKIEWIKHGGIHHAFPASLPDEIIGSGKRTKLELSTQGVVSKRFLGKAKYKHTVNLKVQEKEMKKIKNIFKTSPDFKEVGFKYPVTEGDELRLVAPKDVVANDNGEFDAVWDARGV